jgi:bifunctional DNase/RNase
MIPLELLGVRFELPANQPIVLLREVGGPRILPIWIGIAEAASISSHLAGERTERPMTHDLVAAALVALGVRIVAVHLTDLRSGTFFAELHLEGPQGTTVLSARPSDAVAIAIRSDDAVPILVDEDLFERVAIELGPGDAEQDEELDPEEEVARFRDFLEDLDPDDFREG